ncbi:MAG: hypothetical protein Q4C61_13190 [Lachnospiraceae bacterium]|nr:hypothetical protein [Lachnospiraceae bacterium]
MAPELSSSTREEREAFIKETFWCRSDCDSCGICQVYGGKEPLIVYEDYIEGKRTFQEIAEQYRR